MTTFIGERRTQLLTCDGAHVPGCYNPGLDVTACRCGQAWWPGEVGTWHCVERRTPSQARLHGVGTGAVGLRDDGAFLGWDTYFLHALHCPARESGPPCTPCGGAEPTDYPTAVKTAWTTCTTTEEDR